jgi:ketosteroid isomerase-like protein
MSDDSEKRATAEQFLAGLRDRDWDGLRAIMAEDVFWNLPGKGVISGKAQGVDEVIRRAQMIVRYGMTFTLTHILIGFEGAALSLHNVALRADSAFDQDLVTVLGLEAGKICAIDTYMSDVEMVNAFFVPI